MNNRQRCDLKSLPPKPMSHVNIYHTADVPPGLLRGTMFMSCITGKKKVSKGLRPSEDKLTELFINEQICS